jgi:hypothetical protein
MVYVGLNVHRKRTQGAIMHEDGTEILNRNVPNDPAELSPLLGSLEPGTQVVFEAAFGWGWLAELVDDWNLQVHLAHAKRLQGDRIGEAQERQGRRAHARPPVAHRSLAGGVDRARRDP